MKQELPVPGTLVRSVGGDRIILCLGVGDFSSHSDMKWYEIYDKDNKIWCTNGISQYDIIEAIE